MKSILKSILLISLLSLLVRCDEDIYTSRDYPRLKTLPVSDISSAGARFSAEIIFRGDFEVISYGFVWGENFSLSKEYSDRVVFTDNIQTDSFSEEIKTTLKEGTTYYVRPFIEANEFIVYGAIVSFVSLGSKAPDVYSIMPEVGTIGDTLIISGKNFSYLDDQNKVFFNDIASEISHVSDTLLKVIVPESLTDIEPEVTVRIFNNSSSSPVDFKLSTPVITQFTPELGTIATEMTIYGEGFTYNVNQNDVKIGDAKVEVISASKRQLEVIVPIDVYKKESELSVTVAGQKGIASVPFTLLAPIMTGFEPKEAPIRDFVTIVGENFVPSSNGTQVYFDSAKAEIVEISTTSLVVEVPYGVPENAQIRVISAEQEVISKDYFKIVTPELLLVDPPKATRQNLITLTGSAFSSIVEDNEVFFNGIPAEIQSNSNSQLVVQVPSGINQRFIQVEVNTGGHISNPVDFEYVGGEWSSEGDFPGVYRKQSVSFTIDENVFVGLGMHDLTLLNDFWKYNLNTQIWTRLNDFPGEPRSAAISFTIGNKAYVGLGSGDARNEKLYNDIWEYDVENDNWMQMPDFPGNARYGSTAFCVGGKGFVGLGQDVNVAYIDFYKFEPVTLEWTKVSSIPGKERSYASVFVINDVAYVGLGGKKGYQSDSRYREYYDDMYKYLYQNDSWEAIQDFPLTGGILTSHFAIGSKGYIGMGYRSDDHHVKTFSYLFEYDPLSDSWTSSEPNSFGNGYGALCTEFQDAAFHFQTIRINSYPNMKFEVFRPYIE